jgi:hypothetical protein
MAAVINVVLVLATMSQRDDGNIERLDGSFTVLSVLTVAYDVLCVVLSCTCVYLLRYFDGSGTVRHWSWLLMLEAMMLMPGDCLVLALDALRDVMRCMLTFDVAVSALDVMLM